LATIRPGGPAKVGFKMALEFRGAIAKGYEAWFSTIKGRFADRLEKKVLAGLVKIRPGDKVLDVGCGTGHFSVFFSELGGTVTGLELSPEMLAEATRLYGNKGVSFLPGNAYKLPFADRSFDLVTMITVLELLDDPRKALNEAFRVGKGKVLIGILNRNGIINWRRQKMGEGIWRQVNFYTLTEVKELLGHDKKISWQGTLHLPLPATEQALGWREKIETWLSFFKLPNSSFIGILAEKKVRN